MSNDDSLEFLKSSGSSFGRVGENAERIQRDKGNGHPSVTETYWFEILVPHAQLIAHVYVYMRPNLSVCSAGVWISRGFSDHPLLMDHFNYQATLPMPREEDNVVRVPEIGLTLRFLEPLETVQISYVPPGGQVRLELVAQGVMPPAVRNTCKHYNQFMRYSGTIILGEEEIRVDDIAMRDRSWGEARVEDSNSVPVTSWASGYFPGNKTAFNVIGFDDPKHGVEWSGTYNIPSEKTLMDGWYFDGKELTKVVSMSKRSQRDPGKKMAPSLVEVDFQDANGASHRLVGRTQASCWMQNWPNIYVWLPLMEWELDGQKGWGDCQEYLWADYAKRFWR
ncbi:MAG: hypothetical protein ABW110_02940 [Steroidobacteraceae bacterium]